MIVEYCLFNNDEDYQKALENAQLYNLPEPEKEWEFVKGYLDETQIEACWQDSEGNIRVFTKSGNEFTIKKNPVLIKYFNSFTSSRE